MTSLKKPEKIKENESAETAGAESAKKVDVKDADKVVEQANPDEVPPLPDDDKEFDREPEKRLE